MATAPEVNSGSISVVSNKLTVFETNSGEIVVLKAGADKGRTGSKERDVEGPKVFERRANGEEIIERNERIVRVGSPIKGSNKFADHFFESSIKLAWQNKEKEVVGEERNNKGVDE